MSGECYSDPCYGVKSTFIFPKILAGKATLVNSQPQNSFRMPFKAKITRFGIITGATDVDASTAMAFALRYRGKKAGTSTELCTYVASAAGVFGSNNTYGCAPETATRVERNRVIVPFVKTTGGATLGGFKFFVDYERVYDGGN